MIQKQNAQSKEKKLPKSLLMILALLSLALASGLIIWPQIRNDSYYSTDKDNAKAHMERTISNLKLPGSSIYSNVSDLGCDSRNSVGLAISIHCEVAGESYYKGQGDIKSGLAELNDKLRKEGWEASFYNNDTNPERSIAASNGEESGSRPYQNKDKHSYLIFYFESFKDEKFIYNYRIKELIQNKKITQPTSGESVYGVYITKTYWTCDEKSLFITTCPSPPSKPL